MTLAGTPLSCPGSLCYWLAVGGRGGGGRDQRGPTSTRGPSGTDGGDVTCYFDISFLPFSFDFFSFLFSVFLPLSPFCSLDAAKRKAWKLNRVGSLRNIYSSSSTNTEGNAVSPSASAAPHPPQTWKCSPKPHAPLLCLQTHSCGLSIFLFVCFILPFMFLSAYLNFDLSLQS